AYVDTKLNGRLVLVRVRDHDLGRLHFHLVDPRAGQRLVVDASGGKGGNGGKGADGTDGTHGIRGSDGAAGGVCQNGQDGARGGDGEPGTDGGPGGHGGDGGDGGVVTIAYPAEFPELARFVEVYARGGEPGAGGPGG